MSLILVTDSVLYLYSICGKLHLVVILVLLEIVNEENMTMRSSLSSTKPNLC